MKAKCPLCGNAHTKVLSQSKRYEYIKCNSCHVDFSLLKPGVEDTLTRSFYDGFTYNQHRSEHYQVWLEATQTALGRQFAHLERLGYTPESRYLLDIGCGEGMCVDAANRLGWSATGIDVDGEAIARGKVKGLDVREGTIEELGLPKSHFSTVKMFHVLEHIPQPDKLLSEVLELMAPAGVLMIDVPNQRGIITSAKILIRNTIRRSANDYGQIDPPRHLWGFSEDALVSLIQRIGFRIIESRVSHIGHTTYYPSPTANPITRLMHTTTRFLNSGSNLTVWGVKP